MRSAVCRVSYVLVLAGWAGTLTWVAPRLPGRAPTHTGLDGTPDRWGTPTEFLWTQGMFGALTFVLLPLLAWGLTRGQAPGVNVSARAKRYWTHPDRIAEFRRRMVDAMLACAALSGALWIVVLLDAVRMGADAAPWSGWATGLYLVALIGWGLDLERSLRPPQG